MQRFYLGDLRCLDMSIEEDQNCGTGLTDDSNDGPKAKTGPAPEVLELTRCAACYDQKKRSMPRHHGDSESSSEASDHEEDWDSESSSSSSSEAASRPGADQEDAPGSPGSGPGAPEALEVQDRDVEDMRTVLLSAPSRSRFRRPLTVVSTLQLQVLPSNQGDVTVYTQAGYSGPE
ncbi:unnamed protein product [Gadus morhua 'NCC']